MFTPYGSEEEDVILDLIGEGGISNRVEIRDKAKRAMALTWIMSIKPGKLWFSVGGVWRCGTNVSIQTDRNRDISLLQLIFEYFITWKSGQMEFPFHLKKLIYSMLDINQTKNIFINEVLLVDDFRLFRAHHQMYRQPNHGTTFDWCLPIRNGELCHIDNYEMGRHWDERDPGGVLITWGPGTKGNPIELWWKRELDPFLNFGWRNWDGRHREIIWGSGPDPMVWKTWFMKKDLAVPPWISMMRSSLSNFQIRTKLVLENLPLNELQYRQMECCMGLDNYEVCSNVYEREKESKRARERARERGKEKEEERGRNGRLWAKGDCRVVRQSVLPGAVLQYSPQVQSYY